MSIVSFFDQFPEYKGVKIEIRGTDGYFNATHMSKAMGKRFRDWTRTKFAQELLQAISEQSRIPVSQEVDDTPRGFSHPQKYLIEYIGENGSSNVFVHPDVAKGFIDFCKKRINPSTHIYLIQMVGTMYFKIGITGDVNKRVQILQCGNPFELKIVFSSLDTETKAIETETLLHELFAVARVRGEWFLLSDDGVVQVVRAMKGCAGSKLLN